ncbi:MAG: VWA domain-containing protein [Blastocatellia bacterium]
MSHKLRVKVAYALWLVIAVVAEAQPQSGRLREQTPQKPQADRGLDDDAFRLRVEEVLLPVSVRNSLGKLPSDLRQTDFIVTEDGHRREVNAVMRTPANILFIIDTSGESVLKNVNLNRDLALKMIDGLGAEDRAAIITYGDRIDLLSAWTGNKAALKESLNWKFKPGMQADFYNSILYATEEVLPRVSGRRSIVLITDGIDSFEKPVIEGGTLMFEKALTALHRARATVYVASQVEMLLRELKPRAFNSLSWYERLDPQSRKRIDQLRRYYRQLEAAEVSLRGLAEETGGAMLNPATPEEFGKISAPMVAEIGTECMIAYSSTRPPDDTSFHAVKVYGTRPDILIRFRRGIYANQTAEKGRVALLEPYGSPYVASR